MFMDKIEYNILTDDVFIGDNQKYYYFYCITNKNNNMKYWGVHSTTRLDDGYKGSGKALLREMKTVSVSNYYKDILKFFKNDKEMYAYEEEFVTSDVVKDKMTYNLHTGGSGSWDFTIGRVVVKNDKGEYEMVSLDDERYVNGILKHNMTGKVHVIDKDGNHVTIDKETYHNNSDEYRTHTKDKVVAIINGVKKSIDKDEFDDKKLIGEAVGLTKGFGVFKDINGSVISCPIDDSRVTSGELIGLTSGMGVYKHKNDFSKVCQATVDDPRVLSGELVGINYGIIHCINPITMEKLSVYKDDDRFINGEIISITKYRNMKLREKGIKINTGSSMTKDDYYKKYKNVIDMCKNNIPRKCISEQTNLTIKKIGYIWNRYRNAPLNEEK